MNEVRDDLIPDYDDPKEVHAFYGLAAYHAQVLEAGVVNWAVALELSGNKTITAAEVDGLFERFEAHTFGRLMAAVGSRVPVPSDVQSTLGKALERRNYLVHRFFAVHSEDALSEGGRRLMVDELVNLVRLFCAADQATEAVYQPLLAKLGLSHDVITKQFALMEARARARDAAT